MLRITPEAMEQIAPLYHSFLVHRRLWLAVIFALACWTLYVTRALWNLGKHVRVVGFSLTCILLLCGFTVQVAQNGVAGYWFADLIPGATWDVQVNQAFTNLGSNAGIVDAFRFQGTQSCAAVVNINNASQKLLIGAYTLQDNVASGSCLTGGTSVNATNGVIQGQGDSTVIQATGSSQTPISIATAGGFTQVPLQSDILMNDQPFIGSLLAADYTSLAPTATSYAQVVDSNSDAHTFDGQLNAISNTAAVTNVQYAGGTNGQLTVTATNTFYVGQHFIMLGLTNVNSDNFLNGTVWYAASGTTGSSIVAFPENTSFNHASLASTADTGHAAPQYLGAAISQTQLTTNVVTITGTNFFFKVNQLVLVNDLTNAADTYLNGTTLTVCGPPTTGCSAPTTTAFTAQLTHANSGPTSDVGSAYATASVVFQQPPPENYFAVSQTKIRRIAMMTGWKVRDLKIDCNGQTSCIAMKFNFQVQGSVEGVTIVNANANANTSSNTGIGLQTADGMHNDYKRLKFVNSGSIAGAGFSLTRQTYWTVDTVEIIAASTAGFLYDHNQSHYGTEAHVKIDGSNTSGRCWKAYRATHDSGEDVIVTRCGSQTGTNNAYKFERTSMYWTMNNVQAIDDYGNCVLFSEGSSHNRFTNFVFHGCQADQISTLADTTRDASPTGLTVTITKQNCPGASCQMTLVRTAGNWANDSNSHYDNCREDAGSTLSSAVIWYLTGFTNDGNNYNGTLKDAFKCLQILTTTNPGDTAILADPNNLGVAETSGAAAVGAFALIQDNANYFGFGELGFDRLVGGNAVTINGNDWQLVHILMVDDGQATAGINFAGSASGSGTAVPYNLNSSNLYWNLRPVVSFVTMRGYPSNKDLFLNTANALPSSGQFTNNNFADGCTDGGQNNVLQNNFGCLTMQHDLSTTQLTSQYSNSTTGFTNVTGGNNMAWSVEANTSYHLVCHGLYTAASTGGLNIQFTGPASPTAVKYTLVSYATSTTLAQVATATAFSTSLGSTTTVASDLPFEAVLDLQNGANSGTVQLQAKSSAAVALTIDVNTSCRMN